MNRAGDFDSNDWRAYLHQLPETDAPEGLWARIAAAQAQAQAAKPRRARPRWLPAIGLAAAAALAAVLVIPREAPVDSEAIEDPTTLAVAADAVDVRSLDDAIALAYARNAAQDELDALWQTRERLMASASDVAPPLLARL